MNSDIVPNSYANSSELRYGLQYVILVSPKVTYENPQAKFTLPYVTPNISLDDEHERVIAKNKKENVLNSSDQLGLSSITESNCIMLTVPRHFFYIETSHVVTNKTPCTCNLAHGAGNAADYAADEAILETSKGIEETVQTSLGNASSSGSSVLQRAINAMKFSIQMMSTQAILNAELASTAASNQVGSSISGKETLARTLKDCSSTQDSLLNKGKDPEAEKSDDKDSEDAKKAAMILSKAASKLPSIISQAKGIGKASGIAGVIDTLQTALNVALDAMSIVDVIGVPGQQTIDSIKMAGTILGYAKALSSANAAGAASAGISILKSTGLLDDQNTLDLLQQAGEIYSEVSSIKDGDYSQMVAAGEKVIEFGEKLKDKSKEKTESNETPPENPKKKQEENNDKTTEKSPEEKAKDDKLTIDQALSIARTASSLVENSSEINKYLSIASSVVRMAQSISKKGVQTAELVSSLGGTAAEVAGALGDAQIAQMASMIGSKVNDVMKCVNILTKKNITIADIAEAAFIAASAAAGATASSSVKAGLQSGIDSANRLVSTLTKFVNSEYEVTASQIAEIKDQLEQNGPIETEGGQDAANYIDENKDKPKEETIENTVDSYMGYLYDNLPEMQIPYISMNLAQIIYNSYMRYEDSTYDEIRNFAIEFITLDRLMYWYPGLEQDEYESIKNLSISYLEGRIETEIAINEGKSPLEVGIRSGTATSNMLDELDEINKPTGPETSQNPDGTISVGQGGIGGGNNNPTEKEVKKETDKCITSAASASNGAGEAGLRLGIDSGNDEINASGEVVKKRVKSKETIGYTKEDIDKMKGTAGFPVACMRLAAERSKKKINEISEHVAQKAQQTTQKKMELGKKNTSYCGVGTCSPKIVNVRREYEKGQKFIVANIGGNIDSPVIIGVVD